MPPQQEQIRLRMVGDDADKGLVLFDDFTKLCDSLKQCVKNLEIDILGDKARVSFQVVELKCESAAIAIAPAKSRQPVERGRTVVKEFNSLVYALENDPKFVDPRISTDTLESFRRLTHPVFKKRERRLTLSGVEISQRFIASINRLTETPIRSLGSVSGRLERVNLHNAREFHIWTPLHNAKVRCVFPDSLMQQVRNGIKQNVTVWGMLHYRQDNVYPVRADVRSIEVHLPDDELPRLRDLAGIAKGGAESVNSIRARRDERDR